MANTPQTVPAAATPGEMAFLADRELFWHRFMRFTTGGVVAIVLLLVAMWVFIV